MKRFQKGYTLTELLAVLVAGVVVLAVLVLVALAAAWLAGRVF
jgi:Tfp pilus assembly protein FimT